MAKSIVLDVLESTLGKYVLNLDTDSLNVALWKGKIELHNLQLNVDVVNHELAQKKAIIPFRVVRGNLRNVRIDVPWARISSRSILIRAQDVEIIVEPFDDRFPDADPSMPNDNYSSRNESFIHSSSKKKTNKVNIQKSKKNADRRAQHLKDAEEYRQRVIAVRKLASMTQEEIEALGSNNSDGNNKMKREKTSGSFGAKFVRKIIENLQVEIENVHFALRGLGYAGGIKLDAFTLITTDEDGNKTFVDRVSNSKNISKSFLCKSLKIEGFGIYCNEDKIISNRKVSSIRNTAINKSFENDSDINDSIGSYVLLPISFKAKLRQSDCIKCVGFPKYSLSSKLSSIFIVVTRPQLEMVNDLFNRTVKLMSKSNTTSSKPLFPEYRPLHPIGKGNAKQWWKYAVRCIGRLNRRRSWIEFFIAFQKQKKYMVFYQRSTYHSECSWITPLHKREKEEMYELEMDQTISIEGIMYWRNLVDAKTETQKRTNNGIKSKHGKSKSKWRTFTPRKQRLSRKKKQLSISTNEHANDDHSEEEIVAMTTEFSDVFKTVKSELSSDAVVSSDSILCDIKFTLESLRIDLITFSSNPLTSLIMGTASIAFLMNADSSFDADFSLLNLSIEDSITPNSLFSSVLRCHDNSLENDVPLSNNIKRHVLKIKATKNRFGDKDLKLMMASFEIIASPLLLEELKRFVNFSDDNLKTNRGLSKRSTNDVLSDTNDNAQSYNYNTITKLNSTSERFSDKLASSLVDAWKSKVEKKNKWSLQIHIDSPIVIIPESGTKLMSSMMLINLGSFKFVYGNTIPSLKIKEWFKTSELTIDYCNLGIKHMSIMIGDICDLNTDKLNLARGQSSSSLDAIIEPISLLLEIGIENDSNLFGRGRKCMVGELPSISILISPIKIKNMLSILKTWLSILSTTGDFDSKCKALPEKNISSIENGSLQSPRSFRSKLFDSPNFHSQIQSSQFHVDLSLHKLSLKLYNGKNEFVEANLVSVVASTSQMKDGSLSLRIRMGWFWILDGLQSNIPHNQRFVAHSNLPKSGKTFSDHDPNAIMEDLREMGVFETNYSGSLDLADINVSQIPTSDRNMLSSVSKEYQHINVDAKFTSLFINWNPNTVKKLLLFKDKFLDFEGEFASTYSPLSPERKYINYSVSNLKQNLLEYFPSNSEEPIKEIHQSNKEKSTSSKFLFVLRAKMNSLNIKFHSAKDDLPLFLLTMAGSEVKATIFPKKIDGMMMAGKVDDFRMEIASGGQTCPEYRTILGLAPNESTSLLSVQYGKGRLGIRDDYIEEKINKNTCEAFANIVLSPMRFVHIHAQIMTLMEYVTEGVLGALAAQVASSAAAAALELAQAATGEKIFLIKATGFDFIIPTSAYSSDNFALHAGNLFIRYKSLPNPGEYVTYLVLDNVTMKCNQDKPFIDNPIRMVIDVVSGPRNAPTPEERSINIDVLIDCVSFLLYKRHFAQIYRTLDQNLGEKNSFLRDESGDGMTKIGVETWSDTLAMVGLPHSQAPIGILTHSGVLLLEIQRRLCINFRMKTFSLELVNDGVHDSIICLTAVETHVTIKKFPEIKKRSVDITLLNLECEDRRPETFNSHFRTLISQISEPPDSHFSNKENSNNVFSLSYTNSEQHRSKKVTIEFGSSQIIVIADVLAKVFNFFRLSKGKIVNNITQQIYRSEDYLVHVADVLVSEEEGAIETSLFSNFKETTHKRDFYVKSSDCRFIFIDTYDSIAELKTSETLNIRETVTFRGRGEARMSLIVDDASGINLKKDVEISSDNLEIYVEKYYLLSSPIQLMQPTQFSIFFTSDLVGKKQLNDLKAVALSNIQLVVSMQNLAIIRTLLLNMRKTLQGEKKVNDTSKAEVIPENQENKNSPKSPDSSSSTEELETMTNKSYVLTESKINGKEKKFASSQKSLERILKMNVTLTKVEIVIINDLQALNEAVFKVTAIDVLSRFEATLTRPLHNQLGKNKNLDVMFNFFSNARILANYFNSSDNMWQKFLLEPWEIILKADRRINKSSLDRFTTLFDLESFPCKISFSEQFLISIGVAVTMWETYLSKKKKYDTVSNDTDYTFDETVEPLKVKDFVLNPSSNVEGDKSSLDALETAPLYAVKNGLGVTVDFHVKIGSDSNSWKCHKCKSGEEKNFDFDPPSNAGFGTQREYCPGVKHAKSIRLTILDKEVFLNHLDEEVKQPKHILKLNASSIIFIDVRKEAETIVIYLNSHIYMINKTHINFEVYQECFNNIFSVGICYSNDSKLSPPNQSKVESDEPLFSNHIKNNDNESKFSVPLRSINQHMYQDNIGLNRYDQDVILYICPNHLSTKLFGIIKIPQISKLCQIAKSSRSSKTIEVICKPSFEDKNNERKEGPTREDMTLEVLFKVSLVAQSRPFVELILKPRAVLQNFLCLDLRLITTSEHVVPASTSVHNFTRKRESGENFTLQIKPIEEIQIFKSGHKFQFSLTFVDARDEHDINDLERIWADIPLGLNQRCRKPINYLMRPLSEQDSLNIYSENELLIIESNSSLQYQTDRISSKNMQKDGSKPSLETFNNQNRGMFEDTIRTFCITAKCIAFDHTKSFAFERIIPSETSAVFERKTFLNFSSSSITNCSISILDDSDEAVRLLEISQEDNKSSEPFYIGNIPISDSTITALRLHWKGHSISDVFVCRKLSALKQLEIHIMPEFSIQNCCGETVIVKQNEKSDLILKDSECSLIRRKGEADLLLSFHLCESNLMTSNIQVYNLGSNSCELKSINTGLSMGTLTISTVSSNERSCFIIKIGPVLFERKSKAVETIHDRFFLDDFFRFRIRWYVLEITLNDTGQVGNDNLEKNSKNVQKCTQLAKIQFEQLTVDFQRIFKGSISITPDEPISSRFAHLRSQLSIIIQNVELSDCSCDGSPTSVLKYFSKDTSFFDLCIRTRGSNDSKLVKVDLVNLNLAHFDGSSKLVIIDGNEEFLWKLLDITNRTIIAIGEISGNKMKLNWNNDKLSNPSDSIETGAKLNENRISCNDRDKTIYDVRVARVSPISVLLTFKRQPRIAHHDMVNNLPIASKLMNFFTEKLKFTIDKASLRFDGYIVKNITAPKHGLIEIFKSEYLFRMKFKFVQILKASSLDDWKSLAGRQDGNEDYERGDLVRLTGNLAGKSAGYFLKKVGQGIGDGVINATSDFGNEIEKHTEMIGVGALGACMNSLVSGIGEGVGNTVEGVGNGSGKILRGSVQGVGHIVGGVAGGLSVVTEGVGEGLSNGDRQVIISALEDGFATLGTGVERGAGAALSGAADGVLSVGQGVLKGAQGVYKGLGGVFMGCQGNSQLDYQIED